MDGARRTTTGVLSSLVTRRAIAYESSSSSERTKDESAMVARGLPFAATIIEAVDMFI